MRRRNNESYGLDAHWRCGPDLGRCKFSPAKKDFEQQLVRVEAEVPRERLAIGGLIWSS
jgi:hypothetical protein